MQSEKEALELDKQHNGEKIQKMETEIGDMTSKLQNLQDQSSAEIEGLKQNLQEVNVQKQCLEEKNGQNTNLIQQMELASKQLEEKNQQLN